MNKTNNIFLSDLRVTLSYRGEEIVRTMYIKYTSMHK